MEPTPNLDLNPDADPLAELEQLSLSKTFLGYEFLVWVWYLSENERDTITLPIVCTPKLRFHFWVDDRMLLSPLNAQGHDCLLKGGNPARSIEAGWGMRQGKVVKAMRLGFRCEGIGDFSVLLTAQKPDLRTLQLPREEPTGWSEATDSPVQNRMRLLQYAVNFVDNLHTDFLHDRLRDDWDSATVPKIRQWLEGKLRRLEQRKTLH